VEAASRRQKWIDQSQSLNLYLASPSGKKLDALYKLAWNKGLKTTYYLRTLWAHPKRKNSPPPPRASALLIILIARLDATRQSIRRFRSATAQMKAHGLPRACGAHL
jgi:hypothetical protein